MSGTASAGSAQVGTIGDNSNLVDLVAEDVTITDTLNTASLSGAAADEALLSDGSGNLTFGSVGGVEEVSTFGNLPAIDPPQLAYVTGEEEYYYSRPQTGTPFDISSASFSTDINTQDNFPSGIAWNNDGSRLYEVGFSNDKIYQYTVSTPFDISSATFSTDINTQDTDPQGIAWNDDGSRLYEVGQGSANIYQYTVSTPFDITSASFSTDINTQDPDPEGMAWNNDGSQFYVTGQSFPQKIYQSTVSTPFDISTASFDTDIGAQDGQPNGIAWNDDGSRLYEVGMSGDKIYQYTVSTGGWESF
jgi:sugar lactone lactonase YvrE